MEKEELNKLYQLAKTLQGVYKTDETLQAYLAQQSYDATIVSEVVLKLKKERLELKNKHGIMKLALGGSLLGLSVVITCINFHANEPFEFVMYGFTSVGSVLLFWGLYDVFN